MNQNVAPRIVIVGGGSAGITVAARLRRALPKAALTLIEPSTKHYYQPLWTLVGGGVVDKEETERDQESVIPAGVTWLRDAATAFYPESSEVETRASGRIGYDYLVAAPGIQLDWGKVKGLREALGQDGVCSNYSFQYVDKTWEFIRRFSGGSAIFTFPLGGVKCGGAPQKIMYLADDTFRRNGVRERSTVTFASAAAAIFQVPKYAQQLSRIIERRGIETRFLHNLVEVRPATREAVFQRLDPKDEVKECVLRYDLLHVAPPQSAPDFVKQSPLAGPTGFVDVDKHTLQHTRYPNVFALGDASSLPTSKTGAAVRAQAKILVVNLVNGDRLGARYDGYTSCPLVTGYGKLILAEFDYDLVPKETFPFDQGKERLSMYLLKRYGLPPLYWNGMLRGLA